MKINIFFYLQKKILPEKNDYKMHKIRKLFTILRIILDCIIVNTFIKVFQKSYKEIDIYIYIGSYI
mgnify:CR=1 FL=1